MTYAELPKLKKNSVSTTLSSGITDSDVTIPVTELSVFYDVDSNLITKGIVIGYDNPNDTYAEEITITGASGTSGAGNLTGATRGVNADGSIGAARAWDSATNIAVMFSTGIYEQIRANDIAIFDTLEKTNVIINPSFRINQRGYVSAATLAAGEYGHDRWKAGTSGGDYTFTQSENSTVITIGSGKSLIQVIENKNVYGGTYTLSWAGTATARYGVDSATPSGSYVASPITFSGQTSGTVMSVEFTDGTLKDAQLVCGSEVLPFDSRPIGDELLLCQRYFWHPHVAMPYSTDLGETITDAGATLGALTTQNCNYVYNGTTHTSGGGAQTPPIIFPVEMRTIPTVTITGNSYYSPARWYQDNGGVNVWVEMSILSVSTKFVIINGPAISFGEVAYRMGGFYCDAEL